MASEWADLASDIGDDHPLAIELSSLRTALARYQHEAHTLSMKLQRHSLEASQAMERAHALERENARLHEEVHELRAFPDLTPPPDAHQVPELTLALRNLSEKLTFTEEVLFERTNELQATKNELLKAHTVASAAHAQADHARAREEEMRGKIRDLERKARDAEEGRRLADLVVQEYATLVRTLEGRRASISSLKEAAGSSGPKLLESLAEGKLGLQRLLEEMNQEADRMNSELSRLQADNERLKAQVEAEAAAAQQDRYNYCEKDIELQRLVSWDNAASKTVSRYMKFSQAQSDQVMRAMENLRQRHLSAQSTFDTRTEQLQRLVLSERRQSDKLRQALEELTEDISREAFGRRRETALRLGFLSREESLAETLRRWLRDFKQDCAAAHAHEAGPARDRYFDEICRESVEEAESILESLNGAPFEEYDADGQTVPSLGCVARVVAAQDAVASLNLQLQQEMGRRLDMQRRLAHLEAATEGLAEKAYSPVMPPPPVLIPELPTAQESEFTKHAPRRSSIVEQRESGLHPSPGILDGATTIAVKHKPTVPTSSPPLLLPREGASEPPADHRSVPQSPSPDAHAPSPAPLSYEPSVDDTPPLASPSDMLPTRSPASDSRSSGDVSPPLQPQAPALSLHVEAPENRISASSTADILQPQSSTPSPTKTPESRVFQPTPIRPVQLPHSPAELSALSEVDDTMNIEALPVPVIVEQVSLNVVDVKEKTGVIDHSTSPTPEAPTSSPEATKQALLSELAKAKTRYRDLQKAFRDCHATLHALTTQLDALPPGTDRLSVARTALERLNDYSEDARVELEIRAADEERVVSGYETLLTVPRTLDTNAVAAEIRAFAEGAEGAAARFARKLDDLLHDAAALKRHVHELADPSERAPPPTPPPTTQGWAWAGGMLGGTPRPTSPAPTFGAVMTSPRIARQGSLASLRTGKGAPSPLDEPESAFAALGLRIPMPALPLAPPSPSPSLSVRRSGVLARPRVSSAPMYMLGIGARGSSFGLGGAADGSPRHYTPRMEPRNLAQAEPKVDLDLDADIE